MAPSTMNTNNIARSGASYGIHKTQVQTIPNEILMQMDLGPERKLQKIRLLTTNPHINKNVDYKKGRDDPGKDDPYLIENKRKPERDEGVSFQNTPYEDEKKQPFLIVNNKEPGKKEKGKYGTYKTEYGQKYEKKGKEKKTPYLKLVKGGSHNKVYSAENLAERVEEQAKTYQPKLESVKKAVKSFYKAVIAAYESLKLDSSGYKAIVIKGYDSVKPANDYGEVSDKVSSSGNEPSKNYGIEISDIVIPLDGKPANDYHYLVVFNSPKSLGKKGKEDELVMIVQEESAIRKRLAA